MSTLHNEDQIVKEGDHKGSPYIGEILAVVVLYNRRIEESETISSLNKSLASLNETLDLVVYDNSIEKRCESGTIFQHGCFIIHYFHDASNPGVSKAYNFAAQYAKKINKIWILVLDQDTNFPDDAFSTYISAVRLQQSIKLFVPILKLSDDRIISPSRYCFKRGFALKKITFGLHSLNKISPLNSGMLIELEAFSIVGGYNEKVKLDFSDFQFIERFKKTFDHFYVVNVIALHEFSNSESNHSKLNERFVFYCDGAKNCGKDSIVDWLKYFIVVFARASTLAIRTKKLIFYRTLVDNFFC